jgi:hypothetical protein
MCICFAYASSWFSDYKKARYGCETWSLTLREERRLRLFENKVLRIIFGSKRDEETGECRKLHNEELSDLYSLPILCGW